MNELIKINEATYKSILEEKKHSRYRARAVSTMEVHPEKL
jgi:hypothetical protein